MTKLKIGDKAPELGALDQNGKTIQLKDLKGKKAVIYFYPKDSTPGCTAEACSLRDDYSILLKEGIEVIGISADSQASHLKFSDKHSLPFSLLADTDRAIIERYGVWGRKKFMGKEYDGIIRSTFIIDEKGKVLDIIEKVDTKNHGKQVLEIIKNK